MLTSPKAGAATVLSCCSVEVEGARQSSDVWDVYLTTTTDMTIDSPSAAAASSPSEPQYMLQVLGRCGEPPSTPKTLSVLLSHIAFSPRHQQRFRVQTGPSGAVYLGTLQGIRDVRAQVEAGVDCVERAEPAAAAGAGSGQEARGTGDGDGGVGGQHAGPVRCWSVARPSWWVGGLQEQVRGPRENMSVGVMCVDKRILAKDYRAA
jgi:hypothetical protein